MALSVTLISFAGSIALLLWGTHMVQSGIQRTLGPQLRTVLAHAMKNRFRAFAAGMGVTALLQSSTATGLMLSSFTASGLVALVPALSAMLGANVGTTLIVQALSFNIAAASPLFILFGFVLFRRAPETRLHDLGRVFIGLGLLLLALHQLALGVESVADSDMVQRILALISAVPLLDIILAALLAWAAHSSIAVVLLVMALADAHVVSPVAALALVLGANIGSAINPLFEIGTKDDPAARRLPLGNLIVRAFGMLVVLMALDPVARILTDLDADNGRVVANFHSLFNVVLAIVFLPSLNIYAALLRRLLPARPIASDPSRPLYLDPSAQEMPVVALGNASREALRLADVLDDMLQGAAKALRDNDRSLVLSTRRMDDVLDSLNTAIKNYVTSLEDASLSADDDRRLNEILNFITNLEQAGDVLDHHFLPHVAKRLKRGLQFSAEGYEELVVLIERLRSNLKMAASLFVTDDLRVARMLANEKEAFRQADAAATRAHFERLRAGRAETVTTTSLHLDLLRDIKLINSHVVAAAAYPVLLRTGELLPSRLAPR